MEEVLAMSPLLPIHIAAGSVGIVTGSIALFAVKGATLHRRIGLAFVIAMSVMATTAIAISLWPPANPGNVLQGMLTIYLAVSALYAVRPRDASKRRIEAGGLAVALAIATTHLTLGTSALRSGSLIGGYSAPMFFVFGSIALLAAVGDVRTLRAGELRAPSRMARHLWRMCFALFIANGSFFLGQADEFPEALRIWPVLAALALFPLVMMLYWLWRVRLRRSLRGLVGVNVDLGRRKETVTHA